MRAKAGGEGVDAHIDYRPGVLRLLDQTKLPARTEFVDVRTWQGAAEAIATLRVRGAPAIGIVAAYALALAAHELAAGSSDDATFWAGIEQAAAGLVASRPTAVNLAWAVDRSRRLAQELLGSKTAHKDIAASLDTLARTIHEEDVRACHAIGRHGATLFLTPASVLTHCNTGDLATGGYGTALGIIRTLWTGGLLTRVLVDETRPVLQGARLTAWELQRDGIPYTLIADNMAASFMRRGEVTAVIVGADRIARNGDTANKIGTYGLAVLARAHHLPFIVAAPRSTFDLSLRSGDEIVVEQRRPEEMTSFAGVPCAPDGASVANPAFDITPASLITSIVTDAGVLTPPFDESIARLGTAAAVRAVR
jgi:methylthioribose-1-phosphate isomerase